MAAVTHPNLAVIHGIESWQGIPFLVEEYLAGGTLAHILTESRPTLPEAIRLGITLADVLEQLHLAGIMHCDVKPGNIGFTQGGVVKLLDFGLARLLRDARAPADMPTTIAGHFTPHPVAASASGVFAGTPYYMSPEAVRGERPTPAFDVWALSVVLYEVISGRRPFEGSDPNEIFTRIMADKRPDLALVYPRCPPPLADAFSRLLALNPMIRPHYANELRRELESLQMAQG
jgi:serine/threonine-protein kinase